MGVSQVLCAVCVCSLMQVLLLPAGRSIVAVWLTSGTHEGEVKIGGRVPVQCDL